MADSTALADRIGGLDIPLERDVFLRTLVRELANILGDVVGVEQAAGFISVVGQVMGRRIDRSYRDALRVPALDEEKVAAVLVDLKRRIGGDFFTIGRDDGKIVLGSHSCPFGDKVVGQKAMCMMTSNVFGSIAAQNLGYAKVHLEETIADGRPECRVTVHFKMSGESDAVEGREYFGTAP